MAANLERIRAARLELAFGFSLKRSMIRPLSRVALSGMTVSADTLEYLQSQDAKF